MGVGVGVWLVDWRHLAGRGSVQAAFLLQSQDSLLTLKDLVSLSSTLLIFLYHETNIYYKALKLKTQL